MHLEKGGQAGTDYIARPEDVAVAASLSSCVTHVEASGEGELVVTNTLTGWLVIRQRTSMTREIQNSPKRVLLSDSATGDSLVKDRGKRIEASYAARESA